MVPGVQVIACVFLMLVSRPTRLNALTRPSIACNDGDAKVHVDYDNDDEDVVEDEDFVEEILKD